MGRRRKDWSDWKCKRCGSNMHAGYREYCHPCYQLTHRKMRYEEDPAFKEKDTTRMRKNALDYFRKRNKADPTWNARKQKRFRERHPDAFNYCMCRCYLRRLSPEARVKLWGEIEKETVKK